NTPDASPEELYMATSPLVALARGKPRDESKPLFERIVETLSRAMKMVDEGRGIFPTEELRRRISVAQAHGLRELGRTDEALQTIEDAIAKTPHDPNLLALRGHLRAMTDPSGALSDFKSAVCHGAASFWPYFWLSRHALREGRWADALASANRA